jgi:hypothetical protein
VVTRGRRGGASETNRLLTFRSGVDAQPQLLPCLEERNGFRIDRNDPTIPRIASDTRAASPDRKRAKTTQFDPIAARERRCYAVEDGRHDGFDVLSTKMRIGSRYLCDQFRSGQTLPAINSRSVVISERITPEGRADGRSFAAIPVSPPYVPAGAKIRRLPPNATDQAHRAAVSAA